MAAGEGPQSGSPDTSPWHEACPLFWESALLPRWGVFFVTVCLQLGPGGPGPLVDALEETRRPA